jgi:ClpP class serine protease
LEVFKSIVVKARNLSDEEIRIIISAKVWYGTRAIEIKLADRLEMSAEYLEQLVDDGHDIFIIYYENNLDKKKSSKLDMLNTLTDSLDTCYDSIQQLRHRTKLVKN